MMPGSVVAVRKLSLRQIISEVKYNASNNGKTHTFSFSANSCLIGKTATHTDGTRINPNVAIK
jgi:hypothetical protein